MSVAGLRRLLGHKTPEMAVERIKPKVRSDRFDESRVFYRDVVGLQEQDELDWILFFGGDRREVRLSVMSLDIKAGAILISPSRSTTLTWSSSGR